MRIPFFSKKLQERASKAGALISMSMLGRPAWTPRQYDKLAEESYIKNVVAYRAINEIAKCVGSVPFLLFSGKGESRKEIEKHVILDLLLRPNPMQSRVEFMQAVAGFYLIAGNSYLESVGPRTRPAKELWIKRPDRMKVIVGPKGIPSAYQFSIDSSSKVTWPVNPISGESKILHLRSFHPTNDWYGMSPVEAAAWSVDQHNKASSWNMSLLQNSGRPSGALVVDPKAGTGLDTVQYDRLQADIDDHYSGSKNAGRPLLLEGGLKWQEMSLKPKDMDWLEGKHTSARDIAMAFGMPAQMLGIPGDNTHRNMEEARLWLWEQTIIPFLDKVIVELNWWLTPQFGEGLELAFDLDEVPALVTRRHTLWDKIVSSDFLTINEKREAVGYAPRPEGDVIPVAVKDPLGKEPDLGGNPGKDDPKTVAKPNGKGKET